VGTPNPRQGRPSLLVRDFGMPAAGSPARSAAEP